MNAGDASTLALVAVTVGTRLVTGEFPLALGLFVLVFGIVRFLEVDGADDYLGTYTAYDGHHVATQMLHTEDFRTFDTTQLSGPGSKNKGMALFPRRIGERYDVASDDALAEGVGQRFGGHVRIDARQGVPQPWAQDDVLKALAQGGGGAGLDLRPEQHLVPQTAQEVERAGLDGVFVDEAHGPPRDCRRTR